VQLVDAVSGHQLWAARFDRRNIDIFDLQDEICTAIVTQLEPQLREAEQRRALRKRPDDLDAWDRCQQGLWHLRKMNAAGFAAAYDHFENAVRIDPNFAYAQSLLALCLWHHALSGWTSDPPRVLGATMASAMRAIEVDGDDWLAHAITGIAHLYTAQRHDLAANALSHALELNPSAAMAHHLQGCVLMFAGEHEAAIVSQDAALRLDPTYPYGVIVLADKALSQIGLGNVEAALATLEEAQSRQPNNLRVLQRYVYALVLHGELERAKAEGAKLLSLQPDLSHAYIEATYPFRVVQESDEFLNALAEADVLEAARANGFEPVGEAHHPFLSNDEGLTARELEVLRLMAIGRSNKDIATALGITLNTVATHVRNILAKTFSANRTEAAAYAVRKKIAS
jgi:adenylate cyclase